MIDLMGNAVTCPGGETTGRFTAAKDEERTFQFGAVCRGCPLRAHCTTAAGVRAMAVHAQEARLRAGRAAQATPEGRARRRPRVAVEHRRARMGQLGVGQARYRSRMKTCFQLLVLASPANLRWTWNWQGRQRPAGTGGRGQHPGLVAGGTGRGAGQGPVSVAPDGGSGPALTRRRWLFLWHSLTPAPVFCGSTPPFSAALLAWARLLPPNSSSHLRMEG